MTNAKEMPPVIRVRGLGISVPGAQGRVLAVRHVDLQVRSGETLAIVGESGCGKSLTALGLAGLLPEGARRETGTIELLGQDVSDLPESQWQRLRSARIGMIFQDPLAALNPLLTVGEQIEEAIHAHQRVTGEQAKRQALQWLELVKIPRASECLGAYAHQLSGGMRQRVLIAIAIANEPDVLIADEPTTALDATVQWEVLSLLKELQARKGMALVVITHDLGLVGRWADRVCVMYAGAVVEDRPAAELAERPWHPYTQALLAARPQRRNRSGARQRLAEIPGRVPAPGDLAPGCAFAPRCMQATESCRTRAPERVAWQQGAVWCHGMEQAR